MSCSFGMRISSIRQAKTTHLYVALSAKKISESFFYCPRMLNMLNRKMKVALKVLVLGGRLYSCHK